MRSTALQPAPEITDELSGSHAEERLRFLRELFGQAEDGNLVVWRLEDKKSSWFPVAQLGDAARLSWTEDLYIGVALHDQERAIRDSGRREASWARGTSQSAVALPGLWADVDIKSAAHCRSDLPASLKDAQELIEGFPLSPSIVIYSGYGLQPWWLFEEIWTFEQARERSEAQELSKRFQATLQSLAQERGWSLDNTSDLARILRLPGTFNCKLEPRVPVTILDWRPDRRYDPSEFEQYLAAGNCAAIQDRPPLDVAEVLAGVPEGRRDQELFRLAAKLRRADVPRDIAEEIVLKAAGNCDPPFPERDALRKVKSAYGRYPAGASVAEQAILEPEEPRPLRRGLPPATDFPESALGSLLRSAAQAIHEKTQAPSAICAQSVLAAGTLAVQGLADIELPTGACRPLSGYFLTIAGSGERKSSADDLALKPIRKREEALAADYPGRLRVYRDGLDAWESQRKKLLRQSKASLEEQQRALRNLGPKPEAPLQPMLTCTEPTFEGLAKLFHTGWPSLGVFSAEGGQFIGGHGMNAENRLKTAAALSHLWDGAPLRRVRAGDGAVLLCGRRLALHLLVQPGVARGLLSDASLIDQGLLSRFLVVAPDSTAGQRWWREVGAEALLSLQAYGSHLQELLETPLPLRAESCNELEPRVLRLTSQAKHLWIQFADHVESQVGPAGELVPILGLANKLPEHATRLAATLALVEDPDTQAVTETQLACGIELANYYGQEALRLFEAGAAEPELILAETLLQWLQESWTEPLVSLPAIYQGGPRRIRNQKTAKKVVATLEDHGWLIPEKGGGVIAGTRRREAWKITRQP